MSNKLFYQSISLFILSMFLEVFYFLPTSLSLDTLCSVYNNTNKEDINICLLPNFLNYILILTPIPLLNFYTFYLIKLIKNNEYKYTYINSNNYLPPVNPEYNQSV